MIPLLSMRHLSRTTGAAQTRARHGVIRSGALLGLSFVGLSFAPAAHAENRAPDGPREAGPIEIETIVVTAPRAGRERSDSAMSRVVIAAEELSQRLLPRTLPEGLRGLPSVHVQKTAPGHGSPYIRGLTGNRTLAVIDGIRYNNATYRDGPNEYFSHIDSFTLGQIEVLYGPASSLYGSDAAGGTISVRTRSSDFLRRKPGSFASAEQIVRASSGDESIVSRTSADVGNGQNWGLRLGVSDKTFGDIQAAGLGELPETGYAERGYDARLDAQLSDAWRLTLLHQALIQDDVPRTHSTVFSRPFAGTAIGTDWRRTKDHERRLSYVKLSGRGLSAILFDTAEIALSRQPRRESEVRIRDGGLRADQSFESDLWAFNSVFGKDWAARSIAYGLDYSVEAVESDRTDSDPATGLSTNRIQGPVGDDATYEQIGVFTNVIVPISPALEANLGGRYSYVRAEIGRFEDPATKQPRSFAGDWSNFSAAIRLSYRISAGGQVWGSVSQAFRAPNIADISRFGRSRSTEFEVAAPDLNPETFLGYELGYRWIAAPLEISLAAYETRLDNFIEPVATGRVVDGLLEMRKANSAQGVIRGVEFSWLAELSETLALNGNVTWTLGDISRPAGAAADGFVKEPLSRVQPLTGNISLHWNRGPLWAALGLTHAQRQDRLSEGDRGDTQRIPPGGTPGYTLLHLRAGWEVSENVGIIVRLNNVLDQAYRSHGSGTNEPGRHFTLNIRVEL